MLMEDDIWQNLHNQVAVGVGCGDYMKGWIYYFVNPDPIEIIFPSIYNCALIQFYQGV